MADSYSPARDWSQERWRHRGAGGEIQYLLRAEEQLLQSISARSPLPEVFHKICNALNSEIGNMISFISRPNDDISGFASIVQSARLFGLHKFCSARISDGNDLILGSLEMYSCVPRRPFLREVQLIERATCLAAVAIKLHNDSMN